MSTATVGLKPVKCVVVPRNPPIDKLIAFKRVSLDMQHNFRFRIAFCDKNMPGPNDLSRFSSMCTEGGSPAYFIDAGVKKYHNIAPSASEVEAMSSETESGRTWNMLRELANNNNQTGCLKNARHSVAKLIRDAYEVMANGDASQEVVFDHGMDVVNAFFYPQTKRVWETLFADEQYAEIRKLWHGFNVQENEVLPFTLPLYFRHLFLSGRSVAEITEKISWWLDKAKRVAKQKELAKAQQYQVREFRFASGRKIAGIGRVNNAFESEAFSYAFVGSGKLALRIIRNARGHVHIHPSFRHKEINLDVLAAKLDQLEPGCWYFEKRFNAGSMLMNGSRQYTGVTPTSLTDDQFVSLVKQFATFS